MAFRHEIRVVTRKATTPGSRPRSAAAVLAYRMKLALREPTGRVIDYSKARHVMRLGIYAPSYAPAWARDPQSLSDAIEAAATRSDARLCREDIVTLDRRLSKAAMQQIVKGIADAYVEEGEVVTGTIHLYGEPVDAGSEKGQQAYAEAEQKGWPIIDGHEAGAPEGPHVRRIVKRDGKAALLVYAPHAHLTRTTRSILPGTNGFGSEDRSRNSTRVVEAARALSCQLQNAELSAAGLPADLDHRSRADRGDTIQPRPYLPQRLYKIATAAERGKRAYEIDERSVGPNLVIARTEALAIQAVAATKPDPFDQALAVPASRDLVVLKPSGAADVLSEALLERQLPVQPTARGLADDLTTALREPSERTLPPLHPSSAGAAMIEMIADSLRPVRPTVRGLHDDLTAALAAASLKGNSNERLILASIATSSSSATSAWHDLRATSGGPSIPTQLKHRARDGKGPANAAGPSARAAPGSSLAAPGIRALSSTTGPRPAGRTDNSSEPIKRPAERAHPGHTSGPDRAAPDQGAAARTGERSFFERVRSWVELGMAFFFGIAPTKNEVPQDPQAPERIAFDAGYAAAAANPVIARDKEHRVQVLDEVTRRSCSRIQLADFRIALERHLEGKSPGKDEELRLRREALELARDPHVPVLLDQPGYEDAKAAIERVIRLTEQLARSRDRGSAPTPASVVSRLPRDTRQQKG